VERGRPPPAPRGGNVRVSGLQTTRRETVRAVGGPLLHRPSSSDSSGKREEGEERGADGRASPAAERAGRPSARSGSRASVHSLRTAMRAGDGSVSLALHRGFRHPLRCANQPASELRHGRPDRGGPRDQDQVHSRQRRELAAHRFSQSPLHPAADHRLTHLRRNDKTHARDRTSSRRRTRGGFWAL